jgi:hypothetical protein
MISTYIKDFSWNNLPKLPKFQRKKIPNCQIFSDKFQLVAKNIEGFCFFLLSYLGHSQIWLICFLNDRQFDYITKSFKNPDSMWFLFTIVYREGECTSSMLHTLSISTVGLMPLYVTLLQTWCLFSSVCWCTRPACCVFNPLFRPKKIFSSPLHF